MTRVVGLGLPCVFALLLACGVALAGGTEGGGAARAERAPAAAGPAARVGGSDGEARSHGDPGASRGPADRTGDAGRPARAAFEQARPGPRESGRDGGCRPYGTLAQPFAPSSIWNTPIASGAAFQPASGAQTASIRRQAGVTTWIGDNAMGIYQASASDPLATWTYNTRAANADWTFGGATTNGSFRMRTPADLEFQTSDGWAIIVSEDGRHYLETWLGARRGSGYHAEYLAGNVVTGDGTADAPGAHEGIRAAGMSLMGGLVQKRDLDALSIDHAVAMAISTTQAGSSRTPYVWPATTADSFSGSYSGSVPLGSLFAIPRDVDLSTIGIRTAEGMALARAYQIYGGYVTDTAGPGTIQMAYVETGATSRQISNLRTDMQAIRARLALVTNNTAATPGGGGAPAPGAPAGCGDATRSERPGE
ncbi:hypothetical protein OPKNFCMD_1363 [Methylobacterium crusticola]|uniref:Peptidase S74 domain-containing protein n=3 Tax=Methylobacterium crusticola TaxID=1697972 RepID=A0ABQ4QV45_9HYPH|nr:hypothetical protein [Methylobacterium crusticola]GJD48640.1 hypothetical protein OPKNFCMD_1363 [Methylobacterium crusticola]